MSGQRICQAESVAKMFFWVLQACFLLSFGVFTTAHDSILGYILLGEGKCAGESQPKDMSTSQECADVCTEAETCGIFVYEPNFLATPRVNCWIITSGDDCSMETSPGKFVYTKMVTGMGITVAFTNVFCSMTRFGAHANFTLQCCQEKPFHILLLSNRSNLHLST